MTTGNVLHPVDRAPVRADDPVTSQAAADSVKVPYSWRIFAKMALIVTGRDPYKTFTAEAITKMMRFCQEASTESRMRTCMREWEQQGWLTYPESRYEQTMAGRKARCATLTPSGFQMALHLARGMMAGAGR